MTAPDLRAPSAEESRAMMVTDEDREWIDSRADELFRESERLRGGIRPTTTMPQDYRDYFVVQAAWERAEKRGAERMREHIAQLAEAALFTGLAATIRALPLTEETSDADDD